MREASRERRRAAASRIDAIAGPAVARPGGLLRAKATGMLRPSGHEQADEWMSSPEHVNLNYAGLEAMGDPRDDPCAGFGSAASGARIGRNVGCCRYLANATAMASRSGSARY